MTPLELVESARIRQLGEVTPFATLMAIRADVAAGDHVAEVAAHHRVSVDVVRWATRAEPLYTAADFVTRGDRPNFGDAAAAVRARRRAAGRAPRGTPAGGQR